jgi:hypothetical protein
MSDKPALRAESIYPWAVPALYDHTPAHIPNTFTKLGVHSRAEVAVFPTRNGLRHPVPGYREVITFRTKGRDGQVAGDGAQLVGRRA